MARRGRAGPDFPSERELRRMIDALWVGPRDPDDDFLDGSDDDIDEDLFEGRTPFPWSRPANADELYQHGLFYAFRPLPTQKIEPITVDEVRRLAEPMNKRIWENQTQLKEIALRYEAVIQRRWEKKSKVKRREAVLSAWGTGVVALPKEHQPHLAHYRTREEPPMKGFPKKHLFFWPHLNLEDLCKTEPLLLLLNARARNSPAVFAHSDLEPAHRAMRVGEAPYPRVLKEWTMRFLDSSTPATYGELISLDKDQKARTRLLRWRDVSPGEGLWILEIQDRIYQFLIDACRGILHDTDLTIAKLLSTPEEPEPIIVTSSYKGDAVATSLVTLRYEATYHVPSQLNIGRLQDLINAKTAEVEETVLALREDPAFFMATLHGWYEHRSELLPDIHGDQHPILSSGAAQREAFVGRVVGSLLAYYLPGLEVWLNLRDLLVRLADAKDRLFDHADPKVQNDDDLPHELELAFCSLLDHLDKKIEPDLSMIVARAKWSPPLSHLFRREPSPLSNAAVIRGVLNGTGNVTVVGSPAMPKGCRGSIDMDYLMILTAMADPSGRDTLGLDTCVEELERIGQDPQGKKLMTPHMLEMFSDIVITSECIHQIELFKPWADTFEARMRKEADLYPKVTSAWDATFAKLNKLAEFFPKQTTCLIGAELFAMKYPVEKKRTKASVVAMQAAEAILDTFWSQVIDQLGRAGLMTGRVAEVLKRAQPERTPDWVEPPQKQKAVKSATTPKPLAETSLNITPGDQPSKMLPFQPKTKPKTRGVARSSPSTGAAAGDSVGDDESQAAAAPDQVFSVDKRALKVFSTLYHQPSTDSQPGEIPWADFLYAMHQVGFGCEKLGGSAWQFTPGRSLDGCEYSRGIQFHEPHPIAKVPFHMARMYGRRLGRTYGWSGQSFQLKN